MKVAAKAMAERDLWPPVVSSCHSPVLVSAEHDFDPVAPFGAAHV